MFVPMSELMKEEDFFSMLSGHQREARSVSRCSSRSDRTPLYMNTSSQHQHSATYQNHFFDTEGDWWTDRDRQGGSRHHRVSTEGCGGVLLETLERENALSNHHKVDPFSFNNWM